MNPSLLPAGIAAGILLFFTKGGRRLLIGFFWLVLLPLTFLFGLLFGNSNDTMTNDNTSFGDSLRNQIDHIETWLDDSWLFQFFEGLSDVLEDIGDAIGLDFDGDGDGGD